MNTFKNAVDTGSKYDLKNQGWDQTIKYNGTIMEPQDIGNFHYGYIGRSIGIPKSILIIGGGYNQHYGLNSNDIWCFTLSFCDDPRDAYYIKMGAIKYDNEN